MGPQSPPASIARPSGPSQPYRMAGASTSSSLLPEEHRARERERERLARQEIDQMPPPKTAVASQLPYQLRSPPNASTSLFHTAAESAESPLTSGGPQRHDSSSSVGGRYSSSHMESSVTRLLVATKMLLEALTKWSLGQRTETQVSDIYVRLGNDFNIANVAFGSYGIDMSNLASVPDDLRDCLEACLSEEASPQTLEIHLPRIREIIIGLLQGLKTKQAEYKQLLIQRRASARSSRSQLDQSPALFEGSATTPATSYKRASIISQSEGRSRTQRFSSSTQSPVARLAQIGEDNGRKRPTNAPPIDTPPRPRSQQPDTVASTAPDSSQDDRRAASTKQGSDESVEDVVRHEITSATSSAIASTDDKAIHMTTSPPEQSTITSTEGEKTPLATSLPLSTSAQTVAPSTSGGSISRAKAFGDLNGRNSANGASNDVGDEADPSVRALKSRDALERRASKRFSAYTFNKMGVGLNQGLGMSSYALGGPGGASPSAERKEISASRGHPRRHISRGSNDAAIDNNSLHRSNPRARNNFAAAAEEYTTDGKPIFETPTKRRAGASRSSPRHSPRVSHHTLAPPPGSSHLNSSTESLPYEDAKSTSPPIDQGELQQDKQAAEVPPVPPIPPVPPLPSPEEQARLDAAQSRHSGLRNGIHQATAHTPSTSLGQTRVSTVQMSDTGTSMVLYLQLGRQTKRVVVDLDHSAPFKGLSTGKLRMLFIDKFSYSPGKEDFPSIYVKDPQSGVSYELEDLTELANGSVLTLNIEPLDQVKQHLDLTMGSITRELRELRNALQDRDRENARRLSSAQVVDPVIPVPAMSRLTDAQFAKAGERVANYKRVPSATSPSLQEEREEQAPSTTKQSTLHSDLGGQVAGDQLRKQYDEVLNVRRQLAVMHQIQDDFKMDVGGLLGSLREQAKKVRSIAANEVPTERNFIIAGKARLDTNSQEILTLVEDLLDLVDDLKSDVIQRGVKPKPHTMKKLGDDIERATRGLEDLSKYVETVKPSWKKTWEMELQNIVDEQEFLNHQEGLIADLKEDHANLQDVFFNIQEVVKLRGANRFNLMGGGVGAESALNNVSLRTYVPPAPEEGHEGLSTVMMEVKSQSVDHDKRLKALQAAEKQRQKELRQRKVQDDEFQQELTTFVDGKALRKTGGYMETERVRGRRDKLTIQAMFGGGGSGGAPTDGGERRPPGSGTSDGDGSSSAYSSSNVPTGNAAEAQSHSPGLDSLRTASDENQGADTSTEAYEPAV